MLKSVDACQNLKNVTAELEENLKHIILGFFFFFIFSGILNTLWQTVRTSMSERTIVPSVV